jgi:hypothetical protein
MTKRIVSDKSNPSFDRAARKAQLEERATEGAKAMSEYKAAVEAERGKTERLRAQRLPMRRLIRARNEQRYRVGPRRDVWRTRCMSFAMKHPTRKAALRGAFEFIAAHPDVCTEAILAAENIPAAILIELVRSGFVVAQTRDLRERRWDNRGDEGWMTKAGELTSESELLIDVIRALEAASKLLSRSVSANLSWSFSSSGILGAMDKFIRSLLS